jgi:hypothetical protein
VHCLAKSPALSFDISAIRSTQNLRTDCRTSYLIQINFVTVRSPLSQPRADSRGC